MARMCGDDCACRWRSSDALEAYFVAVGVTEQWFGRWKIRGIRRAVRVFADRVCHMECDSIGGFGEWYM